VTPIAVIKELAAERYQRSALHGEDRIWVEKNCYVDIWIELLHALGCEPLAVLPFVLAIDFEGDQWTFFKPPHDELRLLYGLDVQELNVWRPLLDHCLEHLAAGKLISTEADAFWLPDTQGTDYRRQHTKTTIVINELDVARGRLGYFHNAGYFTLEGEDFRRLFRVDAADEPAFMPLFAEIVRTDARVSLSADELRARSRELLGRHLARRPRENPIARFGERFRAELPRLIESGLPHYHAWAFATLRQLGAAFELAALHLRWLEVEPLLPASAEFEKIAVSAKAFIMKGARAVNGRKPLDSTALFEEMAGAWQEGMSVLVRAEID
jgi:hypothetical protein